MGTQESGFPVMSLAYEGAESGVLTVATLLGAMTLPATREERKGEVDGQEMSATGIRAFGEAEVLMPERAAMEACIAGKAKGNQAADAGIVAMFIDACRREVPLGKTPVPVTADFEIAIAEPPAAYVYVILKYRDKSDVPGEYIAIESLPPPNCTVAWPR
jgi:hypothetical protein